MLHDITNKQGNYPDVRDDISILMGVLTCFL